MLTARQIVPNAIDFAIDQDGQEYIRESGQFSINCHGFYTVAELEAKLDALKEMNCYFHDSKAR